MPDIWMDVDVALAEVPVNILPLIDDTDFKAIEAAVAYNAAGLALYWHFVTPAGAYTVTAVTPTTGGNYDWTDQGDAGIYTIEIPASGGASINNDTEGFGWFTGKATGVLPWRGPVIGFRRAALNDLMIEGGTASSNLEDFFDGTGYAGGTAKLTVDAVKIGGTSQTGRDLGASVLISPGTGAGQLDVSSGVIKANLAQILGTALTETAGQIAAAFKKLFDVSSPVLTAASVNQGGDAYARLGSPAGASVSADIAAVKTDTGNIKTRTDGLPAIVYP